MQPDLKVQHDDQHRSGQYGEEQRRRHQRGGEPAILEQAELDQGSPAGHGPSALLEQPQRRDQEPGWEEKPVPALDQRIDDESGSENEESAPRKIRAKPRDRAVLEQQRRGDQDGEAEREVDGEDGSPRTAEQIGVREEPAEQWSADPGQAHHRTDAAECLREFGLIEHRPDQADRLRDHQRRRDSLNRPRGDQNPYPRRERAGERAEQEADHPDPEQPFAVRRCRRVVRR